MIWRAHFVLHAEVSQHVLVTHTLRVVCVSFVGPVEPRVQGLDQIARVRLGSDRSARALYNEAVDVFLLRTCSRGAGGRDQKDRRAMREIKTTVVPWHDDVSSTTLVDAPLAHAERSELVAGAGRGGARAQPALVSAYCSADWDPCLRASSCSEHGGQRSHQ